jgi:hypothetical protein
MALELRLIHSDAFDADGGLIWHNVAHLIDQQKRIAMRQDALDQVNIGRGRDWVCAVGHRSFLLARCCDN